MDICEIQKEQFEWAQHNFGPQKKWWPAVGGIEEKGELARTIIKADQGIRGTPEKHKAMAADAIADYMIYMLNFCSLHEISLQDVLEVPRFSDFESAITYDNREAYRILCAEMEYHSGLMLLQIDCLAPNWTIVKSEIFHICRAVARISRALGIGFEACILDVWGDVKRRDWKRFPKNGLTE